MGGQRFEKAGEENPVNYQTLNKRPIEDFKVRPNLADYKGTREKFSWDQIEKELDGLPGGGLNLAYEAIDRHTKTHRKDKVAMYWEGKNGEQETYTFAQMS